MTIWVVGVAAMWIVGASGLALLLGSALRRGEVGEPLPVLAQDGVLAVAVPVQRAVPPTTPPYGMRSQAHLSCAAGRPAR